MSEGLKHDQDKAPLALLSSRWLFGVGAVLGFGAKKYAEHNWRHGIKSSRLVSAALRHLLAWNDGEDLDPETNLSHLLHASCCLMFLYELMGDKKDQDDRYRSVQKSDPYGNFMVKCKDHGILKAPTWDVVGGKVVCTECEKLEKK